jgi:hypothetical protein
MTFSAAIEKLQKGFIAFVHLQQGKLKSAKYDFSNI